MNNKFSEDEGGSEIIFKVPIIFQETTTTHHTFAFLSDYENKKHQKT